MLWSREFLTGLQDILKDQKALELVRWILDQALNGLGPIPSASNLADEYRRKPYANDAERVQALIRWAVAKNVTTGFVNGLGGILTLPVTIPGSLAASLAIQVPMVGAIAKIYGCDLKDEQVRTMILLCMTGNAMANPPKQVAVVVGKKVALQALKALPGKVLIDINKQIGFKLLAKFGQRGVVTLVKLVPVAGGAVGGTVDGMTCYAIGQAADKAFRPVDDD